MKARTYRHRRKAGAVIAGIFRVILVLVLLAAVLFFLLRSWTVYDQQGNAHIRFPWSQTAERSD